VQNQQSKVKAMKFIEHSTNNATSSGNAVTKYKDKMKGPMQVASFWKPTPQELAVLNANGCVMFSTIGDVHPPITIEAIDLL
jgi:hypothetical protein